TASAPMATAAVASLEPSSTTTTRSTPAIERAEAMVFSIRCSSFLAGITTATRSGRLPSAVPRCSSQGHLPCHDSTPSAARLDAQRLPAGQGLLETGPEGLGVRFHALGAEPLGQVPDGHREALGAEGPGVLGALPDARL